MTLVHKFFAFPQSRGVPRMFLNSGHFSATRFHKNGSNKSECGEFNAFYCRTKIAHLLFNYLPYTANGNRKTRANATFMFLQFLSSCLITCCSSNV